MWGPEKISKECWDQESWAWGVRLGAKNN